MQILNFIKSITDNKKGRKFFFLPFFLLAISCSTDPSRYGRVTLHTTSDKDSFVFSVGDEFAQKNIDSPKDEKFPKMTQAERKLLTALLKQKKYCLNDYGTPIFIVTSRQEKIYDMTFAHLIEQNYNARSITPRMYFGQCVKE